MNKETIPVTVPEEQREDKWIREMAAKEDGCFVNIGSPLAHVRLARTIDYNMVQDGAKQDQKIRELEAELSRLTEQITQLQKSRITDQDVIMAKCREIQELAHSKPVESNGWVNCKQELPPYGVPVWTLWNGIVQNVAYARDVGEWHAMTGDSDSAPDGTFSHWMKKAAPPISNTEEK